MVGALRRLFRHMPRPFGVSKGKQQLIDPRFLLLDRAKFFTGLRPEEKLDLFHSIYLTNPIASGSVNSITKLINKPIIPMSDDPRIDLRMKEIWQNIHGHEINEMLIRSALIFGFSVGEFNWSDDTLEMEKVFVPQSRQIRFQTNKMGETVNVIQFPAFPFGGSLAGSPTAPPVPAEKFIIVRRDKTDSGDFYGDSLFASATEQFESMCRILQAQIKVFDRMGSPRFVVTVDPEGTTSEEEYDARLKKVQTTFDNLSPGEAIYSTPTTTAKIIGAESFGQKMEAETRLVISTILANVGLPPALLSLNIQSAGAESYARQSIILLQSILDDMQATMADAWNNSFWKVVQQLEGLPSAPVMSFHRPRLLESFLEEQGRELRFNNDLNEVVAGIRPPQWLVQKCGAKEAADLQALEQMIEQRRMKSQEDEKPSGNDIENTKVTDQKATNNNTL